MNRRKLINIALAITLQFFSIGLFGQKTALDRYKPFFAKELKAWTVTFSNFNLSDFKLVSNLPFGDLEQGKLTSFKSIYAIYKPLLIYSEDHSKFIDIYSYQLNLEKKGNVYTANPDIDQAIYLADYRTNKRKRIFFGSSGGWIDEAVWIDDTTFLLVGIEKDDYEHKLPVIYVGDSQKETFQRFASSDMKCIQKSEGYESEKLRKLHVQGL